MRWRATIHVVIEADTASEAIRSLRTAVRDLRDFTCIHATYDWPVSEADEGIDKLQKFLEGGT